MARPLVSVVIPVWNGERHLAEAIESVLSQSYDARELIVVDDGSTDGSAAVARVYGTALRCVSQPNGGLGAARNTGIRLAGGDLLAHLDADDVWTRDSLLLRVERLEAEPTLDAVIGNAQPFFSPETSEEFRRKYLCFAGPVEAPVAGAMLVRRASFEKVGWYETTWKVGTDMSWFLRAVEAGLTVARLPEVVLRRRLHQGNMGIREKKHAADRLRILKASLDRRRAAGRPGPAPGGEEIP